MYVPSTRNHAFDAEFTNTASTVVLEANASVVLAAVDNTWFVSLFIQPKKEYPLDGVATTAISFA